MAERAGLRRAGIDARDALSGEERERLSRLIVEQIVASPEFRQAKTVLLYRAVKGEAELSTLELAPERAGKRLCYPHCVDKNTMTALLPEDDSAWTQGRFGIWEPIPARSVEVSPADIDLVICPCTAFDELGNRLGMGAGYYDRFLAGYCGVIAAAAFGCQRAESIPAQPWDRPMELIFTEKTTYRAIAKRSERVNVYRT